MARIQPSVSTLCSWMGEPGLRASRPPPLRIQIRQVDTLPSPLVGVCPHLSLQMQKTKATGWGRHVGVALQT